MNAKRYVSVICEYNPFHYGHEFQLKKLKSEFDGVICIMSGDIVQRGSVAVANKYIRAKAALSCGADLVLELPLPWCCSSARDFAAAGVYISERIGSDRLAFGAEDDETLLFDIYRLISSTDFSKKAKSFLNENKNVSYPQTVCALVEEALGKEAATAVKKPNNILSIEYLTAMSKKSVKPFIVRRRPDFKSSSDIRAEKDGERMIAQLPETGKTVFEDSLGKDFPRDATRLDPFFIGTLRRMAFEGRIQKDVYSAPDDLVKKILAASIKHSSVEEIISACSDRTYTSARIRRAINALVFGITSERVHKMPTYTCVLAANETGREILRRVKKESDFDVVTKPVHALSLGEDTKEAFAFSKAIEDIISLSAPCPDPADIGRSPYIV